MYRYSREDALSSLPKWLGSNVRLQDKLSWAYINYLQTLATLGEHLVLRAARASEHSLSYRPFPVGCSALAVFSHSSQYRFFTGHNMKVGKNERVTCGEVIAVGGALQAGSSHIPLLAVVGDSQPDQQSRIESHTLHPCFRCRAEMSALHIITQDTIIITATHEAADILKSETDEIFTYPTLFELDKDYPIGRPFKAAEARDDVDTKVDLDELVQKNLVEVMTFADLFAMHNNCAL